MIYYDPQDTILANIASVIEKRRKDKSTALTLVLDPALKEPEGRFENGVISGGSYPDILYVADKRTHH